MRYRYFLAALAISCFFSCSSSDKAEQHIDTALSYEWELVDSLDLEFLGDPMLTDVSSEGSKLIFFDSPSEEIIISDAEGKIIHTFSKEKDTPDAYGFMLESPGFYGENQLAVYGMNGLFVFDLDGNMQKKISHPESLSGAASKYYIGKSIETIKINSKDYLIPVSVRPRNSSPSQQEFYDTYRALELVNVNDASMTEIITFEEGSHFLNGKGYIQSDYTPAYEARDEKLYFVHGGDPQLYVYHLNPKETKLDTVIQLEIPGFIIPEGKDRAEFQEGQVEIRGGSASIRNIHILGNLLLLNYYSGRDPQKSLEAEALWQAGKEEEARAMSLKIEEETQKGTLVYNLTDLSYKGSVAPSNKTEERTYASGGGFAWFQKLPDPDTEEDFLRIYKMKLTEK